MINKILPASVLVISASALLAWTGYEGFSATPYIPVKGDVPTIGNGATHYEDGTKVKMTDPPITRQRAAELSKNLLEKTYATCVRKSLGDSLVSQVEFDLAVDFAGQYGCTTWANSSMVRSIKANKYVEACSAYTQYRFMTYNRYHPGWTQYKPGRWKFDCATPGNKVCRGVWVRQSERYQNCMAVQQLN